MVKAAIALVVLGLAVLAAGSGLFHRPQGPDGSHRPATQEETLVSAIDQAIELADLRAADWRVGR